MPNPQKTQVPEKQYYFDRDFLLQYINQKVKTKVFVDGRFIDIADASDLEDELHGIGYDNRGNPKFFDYRSVEQVKAGNKLVTLDQLQKMQSQPTPEEPEEEPEETEPEETPEDMGGEEPIPPEGEESPTPEEEPEEEPTGKQPQKAHYDPYMIGRKIIQESKKPRRKEINSIVRILEHPYYNITGIITEVIGDSYEIRTLSGGWGRVIIQKKNVRFV